ncbi:MAG: hypothetical protein NDI62_02410 [Burkholderiales bacterium]|nr:hypothetical protein [Burkholderiales bacterium]
MKNLLVILVLLFSFTFTNAQQSSRKTNVEVQDEYYYDENGDVQVNFFVSSIKIIADAEDSIFLQSAIREELTRAKKINLVDKGGDTLIVNLVLQHNDPMSENKVAKGRNGKWGEVLITIISTNGLVAATSRGYVSDNGGGTYYQALQGIVRELAEKFEFYVKLF